MIPLVIIVTIQCLLIWALFSRLYDLDQEVFQLKHPQMFKDEGLFADYLGKADE